jgi:hypothetical protein
MMIIILSIIILVIIIILSIILNKKCQIVDKYTNNSLGDVLSKHAFHFYDKVVLNNQSDGGSFSLDNDNYVIFSSTLQNSFLLIPINNTDFYIKKLDIIPGNQSYLSIDTEGYVYFDTNQNNKRVCNFLLNNETIVDLNIYNSFKNKISFGGFQYIGSEYYNLSIQGANSGVLGWSLSNEDSGEIVYLLQTNNWDSIAQFSMIPINYIL